VHGWRLFSTWARSDGDAAEDAQPGVEASGQTSQGGWLYGRLRDVANIYYPPGLRIHLVDTDSLDGPLSPLDKDVPRETGGRHAVVDPLHVERDARKRKVFDKLSDLGWPLKHLIEVEVPVDNGLVKKPHGLVDARSLYVPEQYSLVYKRGKVL